MIRLLQDDPEVLISQNECILKNRAAGLYNGAYEVIRRAVEK
jgi:hypothetical protein